MPPKTKKISTAKLAATSPAPKKCSPSHGLFVLIGIVLTAITGGIVAYARSPGTPVAGTCYVERTDSNPAIAMVNDHHDWNDSTTYTFFQYESVSSSNMVEDTNRREDDDFNERYRKLKNCSDFYARREVVRTRDLRVENLKLMIENAELKRARKK
jgi:hypothetical protein